MSDLGFLGLGLRRTLRREENRVEQVLAQYPLRRVLAFTGRSIDDVVNSSIVKNQVFGYYKLHKWVQRESEISDLERQWK